MTQVRPDRRLAAILCADIVGYSRLMGQDETGTLATLKAIRRDHLEPKIAEHGGRLVKTTGDGLLVEFPSVVGAVQCAVEVQRGMAERNAAIPEDRRIRFRIGINLGDVIHEPDGDVFGDGVNIAARLEQLAEPGGICLSGVARDAVRDRVPHAFEDLGSKRVKNIAEPVRVYRVSDGGGQAHRPWLARTIAGAGQRRWVFPALLVVLLVVAGAAIAWHLASRSTGWLIEAAAVPGDAAQPAAVMPLPDKPAIAVLPFDNLSGDPTQDYFSDGLTDDIITALARFEQLFVVARSSTFAYKATDLDVRRIAEELGVRYVLEGSVRRSDDRLRVTAQLIDAQTGGHLWAEIYDRPTEDVFAVQDEIIQRIAGALFSHVREAETAAALRRPTDDLRAYDLVQRARAYIHVFTPEASQQGRELLEQAIARDPNYAEAYAHLAVFTWRAWQFGLSDTATLEQMLQLAQKAIELDPKQAIAHTMVGHAYRHMGRPDRALVAMERAVEVLPNWPVGWLALADALVDNGRYAEALAASERGIRLNPLMPSDHLYSHGYLLYLNGRYEEAWAELERCVSGRSPHRACYLWHALALAHLGRLDDARAELPKILEALPDLTVRSFVRRFPDGETKARLADDLRQIGVPEG